MKKKILLFAIAFGCAGVFFAADATAPVTPPETAAASNPHKQPVPNGKKMRQGRSIEQFLAQFEPTEQARLKELAQKDQKAFHKALFEIFEARRKKEISEILALRVEYLNAKDDAEKEKVKARIKAKISADYHRHLQNSERRLKEMEAQLADYQKRLERFKEEHKKRSEGAEEAIEKAFLRITDPDKVPDFPPPPPPQQQGRRMKGPHGASNGAPDEVPPPPPPPPDEAK